LLQLPVYHQFKPGAHESYIRYSRANTHMCLLTRSAGSSRVHCVFYEHYAMLRQQNINHV